MYFVLWLAIGIALSTAVIIWAVKSVRNGASPKEETGKVLKAIWDIFS